MTDKLNLQRLDHDPRLPMRGSIDFERVLYVRLYELFRAIAGVTNQNGQAISDAISNVTTQLTEDINQAITGVTNQIDSKASKSANLSDLTDASTARDNLGLGTAATADIVGTMENGAIIERGSNANGEYVKFADGTAACYGRRSGYLNNSSNFSFNVAFPISFIGAPSARATLIRRSDAIGESKLWTGSGSNVLINSVTSSNLIVYVMFSATLTTTDNPVDILWSVVGRWK